MFIHIGSKNIISDKHIIGIFNLETLLKSNTNEWLCTEVSENDKTIVLSRDNTIISSKVSPYTVTKRTSIKKDFIWRKEHE